MEQGRRTARRGAHPRVARRLSAACRRLSRRRREATPALLLLPRRGVSPAVPRAARRARASRARRGRDPSPSRRRHRPDARGAAARDHRQLRRHGHLSRDPDGRPRYAFIHGNWALANGRPDGRWCGVDEELPLLFDTGCYADFTFPAAPDESQPNIVNHIYWPTGDLSAKRCYESGKRARVGEVMTDRLLILQGPLALSRRPGRLSVFIENSALTAKNPASSARAKTWASRNIHVEGRPGVGLREAPHARRARPAGGVAPG